MKLSELIKQLQRELEQYGDVLCYTNGNGYDEHVTFDKFCIVTKKIDEIIDTDYFDIDDKNQIICHIGDL